MCVRDEPFLNASITSLRMGGPSSCSPVFINIKLANWAIFLIIPVNHTFQFVQYPLFRIYKCRVLVQQTNRCFGPVAEVDPLSWAFPSMDHPLGSLVPQLWEMDFLAIKSVLGG